MLKAAEMRIHHIQRQLHAVESKVMFCGDLQHPKMNDWVLVPGESDVADLARLFCLEHGFLRATLGKDPIRVLHPDHLVMLQQIDMVGLQALEGVFDLLGCPLPRAAVDLGHQKNFFPVAVA